MAGKSIAKKRKPPIEPAYSGRRSVLFWDTVNNLPKKRLGELYSLGVLLQNTEAFVLKQLDDALTTKTK